jgi:hypothetical protein
MAGAGEAGPRSGRRRLLGAYLASVMLHIVTCAAVLWSVQLSLWRDPRTEDETLTVSPSPIRVERRIVPRPRRPPSIARGTELSLPLSWAKQDYGNKAATDVTVWLDWTKQTANFVPRVMLWQMQAEETYMRRPSLRDAVQDVLVSLRAQGVKLDASNAQRVCGGEQVGWFFSYLKPNGDPPLRVEETLFATGETIYRATYVRAADQPEDTKARQALNTLC